MNDHEVLAVLSDEDVETLEAYSCAMKAIQDTINDLIERRALLDKKKIEILDELKKKYNITEDKWHINLSTKTIRSGWE